MKKLLALVVAIIMACGMVAAVAEDYPTKGLTAINPWSAGGGTDSCLRAFTAALEKQLGQTVTVDNRTGASGVTGHEAIADAEADGYTFGMITFELATYKPLDMSDYTYENYDALCRVNTDAAGVTVNAKWAADNGIEDLAGFVAYCTEHPGEVRMGGSSSGSVWHIAGGYLMNATGIEIRMITYADGAADAVKAAAQGEIEGVTVSLAEARSFIESGDLKCLGVMDEVRNPAESFKDIPTCKEQGVDDASRTRLQEACAAAIEDPDFVAAMASLGQAISYMNAEEYTAYLAQAAVDVPAAMEAVGLL